MSLANGVEFDPLAGSLHTLGDVPRWVNSFERALVYLLIYK